MKELTPFEWAVLPLKRYAEFSGRAPRAEYWYFYLMTIIVGIVAAFIDLAIGSSGIVRAIVNLALFLPFLAVSVRRLHDTNRSGWWLLGVFAAFLVIGVVIGIGLIGVNFASGAAAIVGLIAFGILAFAAAITFVVFMATPGTQGQNDYGPDPYGPDNLEEVFA